MLGIMFTAHSSRGHQLVFSWPEQQETNVFLGLDVAFLADVLAPKQALCEKKFQLRIQNVEFLGHPTLLNSGSDLLRFAQQSKSANGTGGGTYHMFNIVLAFNSPSTHNLDLIYQNIILKVTAALKYEQARRSYVMNEIELILGIKEGSLSTQVPLRSQFQRILKESSLARSLVEVYTDIQSNGHISMQINSLVSISLQSRLDLFEVLSGSNITSNGTKQVEIPLLRPYHTLLLLYEPELILNSLFEGASPLLLDLIQVVTPTQR